MDRFRKIAEGLDVAPALAELDAHPGHWLKLNGDESGYIPLLGVGNMRLVEDEFPSVWRLVDQVLATLAKQDGAAGALSHARVGLMPPGSGLPPHFDGIDGIAERRYQIALRSETGVALTVDGETRCPRAGEAWQIDASRVHSIHNGSTADRITILFDARLATKGGEPC